MKHCLSLFLFCCCVSSCYNETESVVASMKQPSHVLVEQNIVTKSAAKDIANSFTHYQFGTNSDKKSRVSDDVETISNELAPMAYIVNIENGGWVIVSATKKYYPILAYSNVDRLDLNEARKDVGFNIWLEEIKNEIESSRDFSQQDAALIALEWQKYAQVQSAQQLQIPTGNTQEDIMCRNRLKELNDAYYNDGWSFTTLSASTDVTMPEEVYNIADQCGSPYKYTIVGLKDVSQRTYVAPLISTTWGQENGYNELCPGKKKAGCVPIAMAQIMNFHQYPASFDWAGMENNVATYASQFLIADIGKTIGVDYGSDGSSASSFDALWGFRTYGYNAHKRDYNSSETVSFLVGKNMPIYMRGAKGALKNGHAWVCDGVNRNISEYEYYVEYLNNNSYDNFGETLIDLPGRFGGQSYTFFHMNWGWRGYKDGWYVGANPEPDRVYEYNRENIYVTIN